MGSSQQLEVWKACFPVSCAMNEEVVTHSSWSTRCQIQLKIWVSRIGLVRFDIQEQLENRR